MYLCEVINSITNIKIRITKTFTTETVSRFQGSLKKSQIVAPVQTGATILKTQSAGSYVELCSASMGEQSLFAVIVAYWGGDDADEWVHVFQNKSAAQKCFSHYNRPTYSIMQDASENQSYYAVKKQTGEKIRLMGVNYAGFFARSLHGGDYLLPYWDSQKLAQKGLTEYVKSLHNDNEDDDLRVVLEMGDENLVACLQKVGDNERFIIQTEEDNTVQEKAIVFKKYNCWETGISYYQLISKLPTDIFKSLGLKYHDEEIEEEGEWKGWYTMNPKAPQGWSLRII